MVEPCIYLLHYMTSYHPDWITPGSPTQNHSLTEILHDHTKWPTEQTFFKRKPCNGDFFQLISTGFFCASMTWLFCKKKKKNSGVAIYLIFNVPPTGSSLEGLAPSWWHYWKMGEPLGGESRRRKWVIGGLFFKKRFRPCPSSIILQLGNYNGFVQLP